LEDRAQIDYESILKVTPEVGEVQKELENIAKLKDFRMRRMLETLSQQTSLSAKKRNEEVLKTVKEEIAAGEEKLEKADPLVLRQTELVEYKENLAEADIFALRRAWKKIWRRSATECLPASRCFCTVQPEPAKLLWLDLPLRILPAKNRK